MSRSSFLNRATQASGKGAYFYRQQTKFAKVMSLQVSVCPRGGACVAPGMGCAWQGGMHGREGAYVAGGVHGGGAYVCGRGGGHVCHCRYYGIRSMSGRYASYWNAFLSENVFLVLPLHLQVGLQFYSKATLSLTGFSLQFK